MLTYFPDAARPWLTICLGVFGEEVDSACKIEKILARLLDLCDGEDGRFQPPALVRLE